MQSDFRDYRSGTDVYYGLCDESGSRSSIRQHRQLYGLFYKVQQFVLLAFVCEMRSPIIAFAYGMRSKREFRMVSNMDLFITLH